MSIDNLVPTQDQLAEQFQSKFNGLDYSVDTIPTKQTVEKLLPALREQGIRQIYIPIEGTSRVIRSIAMNDAWCISVVLKKQPSYQPSYAGLAFDYIRFPVPNVVQINGNIDGFSSVASPKQNTIYDRLPGGQEQFMLMQRKGDCIGRKLWWRSDGFVCTNDMTAMFLQVRACPYDPTEWFTWNYTTGAYEAAYDPDVDPYPITGNLQGIMEDIFIQRYLKIQTPVDLKQNKVPSVNEQK